MSELQKFMYLSKSIDCSDIDASFLNLTPFKYLSSILTILPEISNKLPIHIYCKDTEGRYIGCNTIQATSDGIACPSQYIGTNELDMCTRESATKIRKIDFQVIKSKQQMLLPESVQLSNGISYKGWSYKIPLFFINKEIAGVFGISVVTTKNFVNNDPLSPTLSYDLTNRQKDCLLLLTQGKSIKSIAKELNISHRTTEHHINAAKIKMNCQNKESLIEKAFNIDDIKIKLFNKLAKNTGFYQ